jgi:hypothetical protein
VSFDLIFPHSKIVEIINVATDDKQKKNFFEGHHKSFRYRSGIFDRCGFFTTFYPLQLTNY